MVLTLKHIECRVAFMLKLFRQETKKGMGRAARRLPESSFWMIWPKRYKQKTAATPHPVLPTPIVGDSLCLEAHQWHRHQGMLCRHQDKYQTPRRSICLLFWDVLKALSRFSCGETDGGGVNPGLGTGRKPPLGQGDSGGRRVLHASGVRA